MDNPVSRKPLIALLSYGFAKPRTKEAVRGNPGIYDLPRFAVSLPSLNPTSATASATAACYLGTSWKVQFHVGQSLPTLHG